MKIKKIPNNSIMMTDDERIIRLEKKIDELMGILLDKDVNNEKLLDYEIYCDDRNDKKIISNLGDSYLVVDFDKDLSELNKDEYNRIKAQDDLHHYVRCRERLARATTVWGYCSTVVSIGRFFLGV